MTRLRVVLPALCCLLLVGSTADPSIVSSHPPLQVDYRSIVYKPIHIPLISERTAINSTPSLTSNQTPVTKKIEKVRVSSAKSPPPRVIPSRVKKPAVVKAGINSAGSITATWYCLTRISRCPTGYSGGMYAAISPDLSFLRGKTVTVTAGGRSVTVKIVDCDCQARQSIDLFADAFRVLAPTSRGRIRVALSW
jgi:hypothetical protein